MKKNSDICMLCGCPRKDHDEGLGYCLACNPNCGVTNGCMSFREKGNIQDIKAYKKRLSSRNTDSKNKEVD